MQRLGKNRKSKIEFRRLYSVLADLDINFVFEGRVWFLWVFRFLLPERKPRFCIATAKVVDLLKVRLWLFFAIEFRIPGNRRVLGACSREGSALPSTHSPLIECRRYRNAGNCYSRDLIEHCEKHHELSMKFLTAFEKVKISKMILKTMKDLNCHVWIVGKGKSDHWEYCGIVKKGRKHDSSKWVTRAWTTGGNYQRCGQCKP